MRKQAAVKHLQKRKTAPISISQDQHLFKALVDAAPDAIFLADPETGIILYANQSACRLLGRKLDDIVGMHQAELHPPELSSHATETFEQHKQQAIGQGFTHPIATSICRADGTHIPVEVTAQVLVHNGRNLVIGIFRDEAQRNLAEIKLQASEERFRRLVESSPDIIYTFSGKQGGIYYSQRVEDVLGYTPEYLCAHPFLWNQSIHPEDREKIAQVIGEFTTGKFFNVEYRIKDSEGNWRWLNDRSIGRASKDGDVLIEGVATDITLAKEAEDERQSFIARLTQARDELAKARNLLHSVLERVSDGFVAFDQNFNYTYVNTKGGELLGRKPEDLIGKNYWEEYPEARGTAFANAYVLAMETQQPVTLEEYYEHWGRWFANRIYPSPEGLTIFFSDITERKRSEEALRNSEQHYRTLLENLPDLICRWQPDTTLTFVNKVYQNFFNRGQKSLIGTRWLVSIAENHREAVAKYCEQLARNPVTMEYEHEVISASGAIRWLAWKDIPIFDSNGKLIEFQSIGSDITERKRAQEALQKSEENYRNIFENALDGIFQSTPAGRLKVVNAAMAEIFGYTSPQEMIETVKDEIDSRIYVRAEDRAEFSRNMAQTGHVKNFESLALRKDGTRIWVRVNARAILDNTGKASYYEGFLEDITARKQAEETIRKTNEELQVRLNEIQALQETLRQQAIRDALTGLFNRRYLYESLERELARARRSNYPIGLMMIDIDHFKAFNDTYGHQAGDEVLRSLGELLRKETRQSDIACRYGGEEFFIVMPQTGLDDLKRRAEMICEHFRSQAIAHESLALHATLSIGIAVFPADGKNVHHIIKAADEALYQAKEAGRNQVKIYLAK